MEAQGSGIQIVMPAGLAIKMGVPIYGILAYTNTASDKISRSVPAPGKGILTTAREHQSSKTSLKNSKIMDIKYRKRQLELRRKQIQAWEESEIES